MVSSAYGMACSLVVFAVESLQKKSASEAITSGVAIAMVITKNVAEINIDINLRFIINRPSLIK